MSLSVIRIIIKPFTPDCDYSMPFELNDILVLNRTVYGESKFGNSVLSCFSCLSIEFGCCEVQLLILPKMLMNSDISLGDRSSPRRSWQKGAMNLHFELV